MLDWMSDNRAAIAAIVIFALAIMFISSIFIGKKQAKLSAKDAVFGDPERTKGGWYWSVCGISALLLVWFYFSWGVGRAYFPNAANEMCQVAKLEEAISPIKAALPLESRYYKSTTLVARNSDQLMQLQSQMPTAAFSQNEQTELYALISETRRLMANSSNPANLSLDAQDQLQVLAQDLVGLSTRLAAGPQGISPSAEALAQPRWGTTHIEIPMLPITERGVLFDTITLDAQELAARFVKIRNNPSQNDALIVDIKNRIDALKIVTTSGKFDEDVTTARKAYLKAVERIFKRLDDGIIFPAQSLEGINTAIATLDSAKNDARGQLGTIEALFFPGDGIVKSRTQCTEQGSGRWLPKPTDVVATFWKLASPNTEADGGFKGIPLFWWKWLPVGDVVAMIMPDWIADILPGEYARHAADGTVTPNFKDKVLALAQGDVNLGAVPMFRWTWSAASRARTSWRTPPG